MTQALIIGASGSIGSALATALRLRGSVHTLSRSQDGLDITDESSVASAVQGLEGAEFDLIINAVGALAVDGHGPERALSDLDGDRLAKVYAINAIGPALLMKHLVPHMPRSGRAVFAHLSARIGSIEDNRLGGWYGYRAAKAGLNQIIRSAAIEVARKRPQAVVLGLHPGTIRSALTEPFARGRYTHTAEECAQNLLSVIDDSTPAESGRLFAYDGSVIPF